MLAAPAFAQWKWKDPNGRVQYSDLPPPAGVADKDILVRPASAQRRIVAPPVAADGASAPIVAAAPVATKQPLDAELDAKRKKTEQDEAAKRKADEEKAAAARAENCTRARSQMRALDDGLRIARMNANGEREILDDAQRAEEARRVRGIISSDCK